MKLEKYYARYTKNETREILCKVDQIISRIKLRAKKNFAPLPPHLIKHPPF